MITLLEKGKPFPQFHGIEGVFADINGSGITLIFSFGHPDYSELQSFSVNAPFKIRSGLVDDVLFFAVKPGSMPWSDTYWVPSQLDFDLQPIQPDKGLALTIILVDADSAVIKQLRVIGLGTEFSRLLKEQVEFVKKENQPAALMMRKAEAVQAAYDTSELLRRLKNRYETVSGGII